MKSNNEKIDLSTFIDKEGETLKLFYEWYSRNQDSNGDFPKNLHYGDWLEQYHFFVDEMDSNSVFFPRQPFIEESKDE